MADSVGASPTMSMPSRPLPDPIMGYLPSSSASINTTIRRSDQLDVPHLDAALLSLLLPRIRDMFKRCTWIPSFSWMSEGERMDLIMAVLSASTMVMTVGRGLPTPAMRALGLAALPADGRVEGGRGRERSTGGSIKSGRGASALRLRAVVLAFLSAVIPAVYRIAESRFTERDADETERDSAGQGRRMVQQRGERLGDGTARADPPTIEALARKRRYCVIRFVIRMVAVVIPPLRLSNYLAFLFQGRSEGSLLSGATKPSLLPPVTLPMRLAGLSYGPAAAESISPYQRHVNFSYAYRRLLYEEAYALAAVALLPTARVMMDAAPALRARVAEVRARISEAVRWRWLSLGRAPCEGAGLGGMGGQGGEEKGDDDNDDATMSCPLCSRSGASMAAPYAPRPCGHPHCYTCLRTAAVDDPEYRCRRCGVRMELSGPV